MCRLWYQKPAEEWNEALPIGNGQLGGMVFGRVASERIQLNEDSLWSGGPMDRVNKDSYQYLSQIRDCLKNGEIQEAENITKQTQFATSPHMRHYQTLGDLWIDFNHLEGEKRVIRRESGTLSIVQDSLYHQNYSRALDLEEGLLTVDFKCRDTQYTRTYFASHPDKVIVCHLTSKGPDKLDFTLRLTRKDNRSGFGASYCDGVTIDDQNVMRLSGHQGGDDGIYFENQLAVVQEGGEQIRAGGKLIVEGASAATIYLTARTTYRTKDPSSWCQKVLRNAVAKGYEAILADYVADYKELFNRSRLYLTNVEDKRPTDAQLQSFEEEQPNLSLVNLYYDYGRYLLISSSREDSLPANLQGIWNPDFEPQWGSKYTININTEMNYWFAEKLGYGDLHMALLKHLKKVHQQGKKVAKKMYHCRGFVCHHNTDLWGDAAPQDENISSTIWPMGGAWLSLHIVNYYEYSQDRAFLDEYFPIVQDAVLFLVDYMVVNDNGEYVTGPSVSPENIYITDHDDFGSLTMGPTMDIEIVRSLFSAYLKLADIVDDHRLDKEVKQILAHLPSLKISKNGTIQEWQEDYDELEPGHRHISQLFGLFPGDSIQPLKSPELAQAAERTLERRLSHGGGHTGWSLAWIIHFYTRLFDGENAWAGICRLLSKATLPNLMDNHPPFQIDGNFGAVSGIIDMLVQDRGDQLFVLPALPKALSSGRLEGYRLKGQGELSMSWEDGKIKRLEIRYAVPKTIKLYYKGSERHLSFERGQTINVYK
ncbi:glycosyl hydrolase family 95 catalytic domain-containing protein [Suicoccus acidiformans]|nr:glycoside hydrolase family 95 protein [Suicoccus acidiformans]